MPQSSLLNLIVSLLESRAETASFAKDAVGEGRHLLEEVKLWEAKCMELEAVTAPLPKRDLMKLYYFLRKLTYTGLLGLAMRHFEGQEIASHAEVQGFPRRLAAALKEMRAELVASAEN
ncbi:unnamed protein product [Effrenium voratum]|nr:unnamed protein product [Effrenium voratum]